MHINYEIFVCLFSNRKNQSGWFKQKRNLLFEGYWRSHGSEKHVKKQRLRK